MSVPPKCTVSEKEVKQMLKLQELFHAQYLTEQLLGELISCYVRFVDHMDASNSFMRVYFLDKIGFVLSRPEVVKILEKQSQKSNKNMRQTIRQVMGMQSMPQTEFNKEEQMQMKRLQEQAKQQVRKNHQINLKKQKQSNLNNTNGNSQMKLKERNMKIEMQMKIMREVEDNMKNINNQLKNAGIKKEKKQAEITNIVEKQDQNLNARRAMRKQKLRKKSVDHFEVKQVEQIPVIKKEELIESQKILTLSVERFTTRMTALKEQLGTLARGTKMEEKSKGRVKIRTVEEHLENQEDLLDFQEFGAENKKDNKQNQEKLNKMEEKLNKNLQQKQQQKILQSDQFLLHNEIKNEVKKEEKNEQISQQKHSFQSRQTQSKKQKGRVTVRTNILDDQFLDDFQLPREAKQAGQFHSQAQQINRQANNLSNQQANQFTKANQSVRQQQSLLQVQYQTLQNQSRVTTRKKQYQQIQDDCF